MSRQLDIWHLLEFVLEVPLVITWDLKLPTHLTTNRTIWLASTCSTVFLSLVELECWSADVAFFPVIDTYGSIPALKTRARFFTRPFVAHSEGSGVQTMVYLNPV